LRGGSDAQYVAPGYLVYHAEGNLRAVRFDLRRLEVSGAPVTVVEGVMVLGYGVAGAAVSADGTLVYRSAGAGQRHTMVWVDRDGGEEPVGAPNANRIARLSPDGTRVVFDDKRNLSVWDLQRQTAMRLTSSQSDAFPVWTPDGQRLIWASGRAGALNVYTQAADGTGKVERLTDSPIPQRPKSITPDGKHVLLQVDRPGSFSALTLLDLETGVESPLVETTFGANGEISPDGRWLAYDSSENGRFEVEVFVRPFPDVNAGKWQISNNGGSTPLWARNGRELFYRAPDGGIMSVQVDTTQRQFRAGSPSTLVAAGRYIVADWVRQFDVTRDGKRLLMMKDAGGLTESERGFVLVQHWAEELKRLLPLP
jgi:serine/threonine-protein kinase